MARRKRRGWSGPLAAARIHGCPDVVATMWIILVLFGTIGGVLCYPPWGAAPVPPEPVQVMTDVTNHLGVTLLQDFACLPGNVAFSPYGAASVLIVLWEGARGESGVQLRKALGLPSTSHPTLDYGVIRLGMRDIHRHLRTYFAHDGYLNGLAFGNTSTASFKPSFRQVLRFYGYDPDTAMTGGGEIVTPPWMKHMTSTTPFSEQTSTTSPTNATETAMESKTENTTMPTTTISLTIPTTLSSPPTTKPVLPVAPKPTTPMPTTTVKPAKTTKSTKITTQKTSADPTTDMTQSDATMKPTSKPLLTTLPDDVTSTLLSTPPTANTTTSTIINNATTSPSTLNTGTTLKDFKEPSVSALTDITDFTSSTRVTRRMPGSDMATEFEMKKSTTSTTVTPISDETSTIYESTTPTTQNIEVAISSDAETTFTPTVLSTENIDTPTLSSMLTALSSGKTSDSGFTTTFILMAMTTQNFQQTNLTEMLPQSLNLVTNNQIIPQNTTTPLPPESSTTQPTTAESVRDTTTSPNLLTSTSESFPSTFFTTTSPTTIEESETSEVSAEVTTERVLTEGTTSTEKDEDFVYSTTPEYMTTTYSSDNMVESDTTSGDATLSTPTIFPDVLTTTTDTSEVEMSTTETTTVTEEATTQVPSSPENLDEEPVLKSRKKRLSEGENNLFPEIQLHLHGNAMLSADDKDMDTMWQAYQEKFGLPLGPFQVIYQGHEPTVKWVPMIRMVKRLPFAYISRLQAQILMLPLDDERYKLLLMLPVGDNDNGFEGWRPSRQKRNYPFQPNGPQDQSLLRLIEDLRSVPLREIVSSVQPCLVAATIPPFLIRGLLDLTPSLSRMGVRDVFDTKTADLSGMSNDTNLWVRGVEQTVSVAVDINGIFGRNRGGYSARQDDHRAFRRQEDWSNYKGHSISHHQRRDASQGHWGSSQAEGERVDGHFMVTRSFLFFVVDTSTRVALMAGKVVDPTSTKNSCL